MIQTITQAQLDQAAGQLVRDQALLANAELDVQRYRTLLAKDSIARQQVDAQEALVRQYRGAVQADQATVDTARLQLTYARITAPISGLLGLRQIDVGNVIRAGDANGLVVITETQPITAIFSIPADSIGTVQARLATRENLQVDLYGRDGARQHPRRSPVTHGTAAAAAPVAAGLGAPRPAAAAIPNRWRISARPCTSP